MTIVDPYTKAPTTLSEEKKLKQKYNQSILKFKRIVMFITSKLSLQINADIDYCPSI